MSRGTCSTCNSRNTPMWACFCCLLARFLPQHQKRVHVDAFLVLGDYRLLEHQTHAHVSVSLVFAGSPSTPTPKTRPCGRVFGVGCLPFTPTRCNGPHFLACMTPWGHCTYIGFV